MAAVVEAAKGGGGGGGPQKDPHGGKFGRVKANLQMGVLGLPNVGKSSLFNLLTQQAVAAENYAFCTIEPNKSRCPVPDKRYEFLCDIFKPASKVPAYLKITDIAGLIKGASEGAGLGNAFLSHIQAVDGLYHVIRAFDNDAVIHVEDSVDPVRDLDTIMYELCRKDTAYVQKVREAKEMDVKRDPKKKLPPIFFTVMDKVQQMLDNNIALRTGDWNIEETAKINELIPECITLKPIVYLPNVDAKSFRRKGNKWLVPIANWVKEHGGGQVIPVSVEWEQELWELRDKPEEKKKFLEDCQ